MSDFIDLDLSGCGRAGDVCLNFARRSPPRMGVGLMHWSFDEAYLLTKNENCPSVLWVWRTSEWILECIIGSTFYLPSVIKDLLMDWM